MINELRIGNYIYTSEDFVIKSYSPEGLFNILKDAELGKIKPIPLTEEWLFKLGYHKSSQYFRVQGHVIWICNHLFMCDKNGITIKHIHQLQNLYFALTNEELTFNK